MAVQIIEITKQSPKVLELLREKGVPVDTCYQCLRCSAGCPMLSFMDYAPNRVIRMLQCGQEAQILSSHSIWMCASCHTCTTRCPNDVDIAHMMDVLRQEAQRRNIQSADPDVEKFHQAFVAAIKRGRVHELEMIGRYKLSTKKFFDDMQLGFEMFKRGRMKIIPDWKVPGAAEVKKIFKMAKKGD